VQVVIETGPSGYLTDGRGGPPILDAAVVIEGERITSVGRRADGRLEPEARVISADGGAILPGLIDVHVHITNDGGPGKTGTVLGDSLAFPADLTLTGYANALRSLRMGYTTLRNLHAPGYVDLAVRDAIASGRLEGPRSIVCGQGLCISGGHMDTSVFPDHVSVGGRVGFCDTPEGFRAAVRQHAKRGVDFIKINSDVGSRDPAVPYRQEMSFDEMKAACDEAHRFGYHVAAHTSGGPPIEEALLAGVDTIEHGHWLTERAIEIMLAKGAFYAPTLIVNSRNFAYDRETLGASEASWRWMKAAYDAKWPSLRAAKEAGVKIAAGSDAGFLVDHGENAAGLGELVKGGFTPLEAIRAATETAADLLGLGAEIGTLTVGKMADVVVVAGNPLEDIGVLQCEGAIAYVVRGGRMVKGEGVGSG